MKNESLNINLQYKGVLLLFETRKFPIVAHRRKNCIILHLFLRIMRCPIVWNALCFHRLSFSSVISLNTDGGENHDKAKKEKWEISVSYDFVNAPKLDARNVFSLLLSSLVIETFFGIFCQISIEFIWYRKLLAQQSPHHSIIKSCK